MIRKGGSPCFRVRHGLASVPVKVTGKAWLVPCSAPTSKIREFLVLACFDLALVLCSGLDFDNKTSNDPPSKTNHPRDVRGIKLTWQEYTLRTKSKRTPN